MSEEERRPSSAAQLAHVACPDLCLLSRVVAKTKVFATTHLFCLSGAY